VVRIKYAAALLLIAGVSWGDITSITTLPGGTNGSVQTNKGGRFNGDSYLTYSTSTHVLRAEGVSLSSLTANGLTYTFPSSQTGGYFLQSDGAGGLSWQTPSTFIISSGTNLAIFDGPVRISSPTSAVVYSTAQFIVNLQGATTAAVSLDPSSVTLLGQSIDISANTNLAVSAPIVLIGDTLSLNPSSATLLGPSIDLTSEVAGILPAANLPATVVYTNTTQTIDGVKTFTSSVTVTHPNGIINTYGISSGSGTFSSGVTAGNVTTSSATVSGIGGLVVSYGGVMTTMTVTGSTIALNGVTYYLPANAGTSGQVLSTSGGLSISTLTWATSSGGSSIYAATSTASFPYGFSASTGVFSTGITASYLTSGEIPFLDSNKALDGDSSFVWDTSAGALTLGGGSGDGTSWMTVNAGSAINALYVKGVAANTAGINVQGSGTVGTKVTGNSVTAFVYTVDGTNSVCNGASTGDACWQAKRTAVPPNTRGSRLFIQGDNYPDGSSTLGPPQLIVAPTGVVLNAGPQAFSGQVAFSTPIAPVHVGYAGRAVSNIVSSTQAVITNYAGNSYFIAVDSTSGVNAILGVNAGKAVVGTSTNTWSLPTADSAGCFKSDGSGTMSIASCGSGGMSPGATYYIQVTEALQSGATFYVSSGTVNGQFSVTNTGNAGLFTLNSGLAITSPASTFGNFAIAAKPYNAGVDARKFTIATYSQDLSNNVTLTMDPASASTQLFGFSSTYAPNEVFSIANGYSIVTGTATSSFTYGTYPASVFTIANDETANPGNTYLNLQDNAGSSVLSIKKSAIKVPYLTASQFLKTDSSKNLISYDLFNDSPTYAGNASWTSAQPSTFTALTVSGLSSGRCVQTTTGGRLTITGSACASGGGGSSTLEVGLASTSTFKTSISSPTASIGYDRSQFSGQLLGSATAFITIAYSTSAVTASYVATSTDTLVAANCGSACTVTLPTAIGISGKVYRVKALGAGIVTIATTSSQTIDGSLTVTPNPNLNAMIEVISDGINWLIE
jgi:hypothetical protein